MGNVYLLSYNNELLSLAEDVGNRLLPAFNTTTGLPYPRVRNLCMVNVALLCICVQSPMFLCGCDNYGEVCLCSKCFAT